MAKVIGVTGPRAQGLTDDQARAAAGELIELVPDVEVLHVGCATGLDAIALGLAKAAGLDVVMWKADKENPAMPVAAKLQARSKRMIRALAADGGALHAFPNKPCPVGVTASAWQGSGTWGTARYAMALGVPVVWHRLGEFELPGWAVQQQPTLF